MYQTNIEKIKGNCKIRSTRAKKIANVFLNSKKLSKSLFEFLSLFASLWASYGVAFSSLQILWEKNIFQGELLVREAMVPVLSIGIFNILFFQKNINLILILQSIGLFIATKEPEATLVIGVLSQILLAIYLLIKYFVKFVRSFLKATDMAFGFEEYGPRTLLNFLIEMTPIFIYMGCICAGIKGILIYYDFLFM